jgi:adenylate cyclase
MSYTRPEQDRLDSWKEIAAYLRRGARTVQRWEREEGLPVHRLQHEKLGSVYAYRAELDAWFVARGAHLPPEPPAPATPSIAVLPFTDLSPAADQRYLCDGIAEEIVHALSRVQGIQTVRSDTTAKPAAATVILEGSVKKSGDRLRIAIRLLDAESGAQQWAQRYDGCVSDIFAIEDQITEGVLEALHATLQPHRADARECYDRGRRYYYQYSPKAMEFAIRMFVRAIELDPEYAQAYAGLADCWSYTYLYSDRNEFLREQAEWASKRALEINPKCAQAQASRGLSLSLHERYEEADQAFAQAIALDAGLFEAHYFRARHCFALGRLEEAAAAYATAMQSRPDDYQSPLLSAQIHDDLGRADRAAELRRKGIARAERHLALNPDDARALYMAANGLAALGEPAKARQFAERAVEIRPDDSMLLYNVGCVFSLLGLCDAALDCLEKAVAGGLSQRGWYQHDSNLNAVRQHPRFVKLLARLQ